MKFRTEITCPLGEEQMSHDSNIVLLGSCFSAHMADKFAYFKFNTFTNPFGILFNPKAIETSVKHCIEEKVYTQDDLLKHGESWLSLNHHSSFNKRNTQQILDDINRNIEQGHEALKKASHIIITLGTSWVYQWIDDNRVVGNCHKIPQKRFRKQLLTAKEIVISLKEIKSAVQSINKEACFIFTVSPVRHLKDGFIENTLSKSLLHQGIYDLKNEVGVNYFPAYEIMMDDLRDYRYYQNDFVHPNNLAIKYIWDKFSKSWIAEDSQNVMAKIDDIQRSLDHLPFDSKSEAHQLFLKKLDSKIDALQKEFPKIEFHKKRK